jgi:prevent-host-death family protein
MPELAPALREQGKHGQTRLEFTLSSTHARLRSELMPTVNMFKAKSALSKLVKQVESGAEEEIIIARHGKPAAKLVPLYPVTRGPVRLGLLKGKYASVSQDEFYEMNDEIAALFNGET